ncbi:MAG: AEC family transporter [Oscillospiraceae bacterium]|nr:AEC family transporter [Oscillospiraceae bacterium]
MEISSVFEQMLVLLILLLVGVAAAKTGVVDQETNRRLTRFALVFPQSAQIISSVVGEDLDISAGQLLGVFGAACVMYGVPIALGFLTPVLYRFKKEDRGIYSFMTIFGNVGFMGFPVAETLFGSKGLFYAAILNMPFNLLAYTLGISLLHRGQGKTKISWRQLLNAPLISAIIAIVLLLTKIHIPTPVADAIDLLGDTIVPLAMIIIGASLGSQKMSEVFGDWRAYAFAPVRLLVAPVLVWAALRLFITDTVLLGTMTVLAAMPVASFATMLSIQYGGNERIASRTVFVTTVLSVVTIPIVCWLLPIG